MKIAHTGYPLVQLLTASSQRKAQARVQNIAANPVDTTPRLPAPDRAIIKYIGALEGITSDILRILDDNAQTEAASDISRVADQLPGSYRIKAPGAFIYFPPSDAGGDNAEPAQVIIMQDGPYSDPAFPDVPDDQAAPDIARAVAQKLSVLGSGIGLKSAGLEPAPARDRFIIFTEATDNEPVISAVRQGPSGVLEVLSQERIRDEGIPDIVRDLKKMFTATGTGDNSPDIPLPDDARTAGKDGDLQLAVLAHNETVRSSGPGEIARQMISSMVSKFTETNRENTAEDQDAAILGTAPGPAFSGNVMATDTYAGVVVRYINTSPLADMPDKDHIDALLVDKLISLEKLLQDIPAPVLPEDLSEEDMAALQNMTASIREQVPGMVGQALHIASRNYQVADGSAGPDSLGIRIDENAALRIDRALLTESLSEKRAETVKYIQDFGNSFQDKIRYDFNPLAGLFGSGENSGVPGTDRKHGADDDSNDERKSQLERQLNEVQMLLKSSYELSDLFLQGGPSGQPGFFDETDR